MSGLSGLSLLYAKKQGETLTVCSIKISYLMLSYYRTSACGVDGVSAEHFLYAHDILHVFLSLLFTSFITHGHLPSNFMKTALVPIIKNKTGDTSDKNNYRPIALVTAASKIFEICILEVLEMYLITHDHQYGFKSKHSTDMCIFTVKSIVKYYTRQNSPVYTCFLDASKAFDRINNNNNKSFISDNSPYGYKKNIYKTHIINKLKIIIINGNQ